MKKVFFVGALLFLSVGCSKQDIKAEETMESLETPEDIENHILRCEFGEDCMFI